MKRILIHENTAEIQGDIDHIQIVCFPVIQKIIKEYDYFNLGEMTTELLKDALFNNSKEIEQMFQKQAEMDTMQVKNPVLKQNLHNGVKQAIIDFRLAVNGQIVMCNRVLLKLITIEGKEPVLTDENLEKLKELHRTYVSPEEAKFFELHKAAAKSLNELFVNMKSSLTIHDIIRAFTVVDGEVSVPKAGINYSYFLKQKNAVSE